jgi:hypothetical protein
MPVSLDLRKAHKVRRHGDLLAIYTWGIKACEVLGVERLRNKLSALSHTDVRAHTADADASCGDVRGERNRLAALLAEGASLVAEGQQRGDELAVRLRRLHD